MPPSAVVSHPAESLGGPKRHQVRVGRTRERKRSFFQHKCAVVELIAMALQYLKDIASSDRLGQVPHPFRLLASFSGLIQQG